MTDINPAFMNVAYADGKKLIQATVIHREAFPRFKDRGYVAVELVDGEPKKLSGSVESFMLAPVAQDPTDGDGNSLTDTETAG